MLRKMLFIVCLAWAPLVLATPDENRVVVKSQALAEQLPMEETGVLDRRQTAETQPEANKNRMLDESAVAEAKPVVNQSRLLEERKAVEVEPVADTKRVLDESKAVKEKPGANNNQVLDESKTVEAKPVIEENQALMVSVAELRSSIGNWDVVTEFLNDDGTVAKSVTGTYAFSWVIPDRVVSGQSRIPEFDQTSAILFYINEKAHQIEMVSVGQDGKLWIMTGALGGTERLTEEYKTADGGTGQLRFTRYNVVADGFESKMHYTHDGGKTWKPGNHQTFSRAATPAS